MVSDLVCTAMNDREVQITLEMKKCRYFNGLGFGTDNHGKLCEAGVNYRELVGGDTIGWTTAIPCLGGMFRKAKDRLMVPCTKFATLTRDEAEELVDRQNATFADVLSKLAAGEDVPSVIVCGRRTRDGECPTSTDGKCPSCGGELMPVYGIGSGYGGIGGYNVCTNEDCTADGVYDFVKDTGE